ncbi:MAG: hypothetical protein WAL50_06235 [Kineosporiaceae bacterium]
MLWKWKLARSLDDVLHLLNGESKYDHPVPDARICMTWRGDHPRFWVFATKAARTKEPYEGLGGWGCTLATEPDDVMRFLSNDDHYPGTGIHAQIAAAWAGDHHRFFVFYRNALPGHGPAPVPSEWGWKLATDADDALAFLNGSGAYSHPVSMARVATAHRDDHDEYFIFYQRSPDEGTAGTWQWQTVASADGVPGTADVKGQPPVDFQVVAPSDSVGSFQVFTHPGEPLGGDAALTGARRAGG